MNQLQTPLFDALERFYKKNKVSFHVPGHKNGHIFMEKGRFLYETLLKIDATELTGLDDLHAPEGPIMEAQQLLADLYKVQNSYFLVNGSTIGNMAMIMAVCEEGDTVLVQRNCHKSIHNGLMLANAKPIFLTPNIYEDWGIAGGIDIATVSEALDQYPETKAIILTYPNYYGLAEEIEAIITLAHRNGVVVLIDEAHGAHFPLGGDFPKSAIAAGADIIVQSAHKSLPAMTMGSYLHVNSSLVDRERIQFYLGILQSSSPSYPIMGSLDLARAYLATFTEEDRDSLVRQIVEFKKKLASIFEIKVLEAPKGVQMDPLKVSIRSTCGLSGYELQELLEGEGIYAELADPQNVLLVLPLLKSQQVNFFTKTVGKIRDATENQRGNKPIVEGWNGEANMAPLALSYSDMKQMKRVGIPFEQAIGKISAEMVIPYPPGIPLIMSGEMITTKHIEMLESLLVHHSRFHGGTRLNNKELIIFESK